jgi:hypothetical protein
VTDGTTDEQAVKPIADVAGPSGAVVPAQPTGAPDTEARGAERSPTDDPAVEPSLPTDDPTAIGAAGATGGASVEPPPATGDQAVDAALQHLHDRARSGGLDAQAEAAEATHRALQDRLADLGGD